MACICKHKLAALVQPSVMASLSTSLQVAAKLPFPSVHAALHAMATAGAVAGAGPYGASLLTSIQGLQIPPIALIAGLPTLAGLVNVHTQCKLHLGLPLPAAAAPLASLLATLNVGALSPLMSLNLPLLLKLQAYAAVALQLKAQLNLTPLSENLSEQIGPAVAAGPLLGLQASLTAAVPPLAPPLVAKLGQIQAIHSLMAMAVTLGVDLRNPAGLAQLAVTIRALVQLKLPPLPVPPPDMIARLTAVAQIQEAFGATVTPSSLSLQLRAMAALHIALPPLHAQLGMKQPTPAQVHSVLALNLPQLAAVNWQIPTSLPLLGLLPLISVALKLQAMGAVSPTACHGSCPMAA